jgi:hypothetical protein
MLALALLHDVPVWPLWSNSAEIYAANKVKDEFDIGAPDTIYTPFWDANAAKVDHQKVYISTYSNKNGILAVVSNLSDEKVNVATDFSSVAAAKVLLSDKAWNAEKDEKYIVSNSGKINLTIPRHDFVLLRIN